MRVLITGGAGQLAAALRDAFEGNEVAAPARDALDIRDPAEIARVFEAVRPDLVLNTAAYNTVDRAESEPEAAFAINGAGPHLLAAACERLGIPFVHYSTDYVFGGQQDTPYQENHPVGPINLYGVSKAAGEMAVRAAAANHLIIRTTGLFGLAGRTTAHGNFVETMIRLGTSREVTTVVADAVLTPTSTVDLAGYTRLLLDAGVRGTAHVTNSGQCSWHEFATIVFREARLPGRLEPIPSKDYPTTARRPRYSVLAHDTIAALGLPEPRSWDAALHAYLAERFSRE
jgi:dTDP-4-dehydrorhamnose reductase